MNAQILEILNKNGVHIPTVREWMEIANLSYKKGSNKFPLEVWVIELMQRFEELTREKFTEINTSTKKDINIQFVGEKNQQPVLLKKEMFVCEEKEKVFFEWNGVGSAVDYSEITEGDNLTLWEFLKLADRTGNWKFTENFVNELLK